MAGIYLHIPFCKQKCHYCDFHFSTSLKTKPAVLKAMAEELLQRKDYLNAEVIETIYLGGGTPGILSIGELNSLFKVIYENFKVSPTAEITLEANPDDLNKLFISELASSKVNRLSIGIQSFDDEQLKQLNRAHSSEQAIRVVKEAQDAGFDNISIDLIFGLPSSTIESWQKDLGKAFELNVQHFSAYSLTIESGTAFSHFEKTKRIILPQEEVVVEQMKVLMDRTATEGFQQYEISNYAKEGFLSKHNTAYWQNKPYLGIGPSAHSYNGTFRQWNVAHNIKYANAVLKGESYFEQEEITVDEAFNEYLLTSLRTVFGIDIKTIQESFGKGKATYFTEKCVQFISQGDLQQKGNIISLTAKGKFMADYISRELFFERD